MHRGYGNGTRHHVGRWHAYGDRWYHAQQGINPLECRRPTALMPVYSARGRKMVFDAEKSLKQSKLDRQKDMCAHCSETLLRSDGNGSENLRGVPPVYEPGKHTTCNGVELRALVLVLAAVGAQSACVGFQRGRSAVMPRERPRMGSRRGGIRGRALPQQNDYNSPSSSIEVTSLPQRFQGSNEEEGGHNGRSPNSEEGQMELPMLRYRLPCPQVNSTLVVSIMIEPGVTQNMEAESLPDGQRSSREESPIACLPVGAGTGWLAPGREHGPDLERPATNFDPDAGPSSHAGYSLAGPSRPAQEGSPDAVIQLSDSEDTLRFGCRIEEAPQTTEDD